MFYCQSLGKTLHGYACVYMHVCVCVGGACFCSSAARMKGHVFLTSQVGMQKIFYHENNAKNSDWITQFLYLFSLMSHISTE